MGHILLVDDQYFMRESLLHELTRMGHEVSRISDRDTLFIFLEDHTPDLALLDAGKQSSPDLQTWPGSAHGGSSPSPGRDLLAEQ